MTPGMDLCEIIDWLGLHLAVPTEWQMVRHAVSPEAGRLVFVDRRRERLTVLYRSLRAEPDLARMLTDHRARELTLHPKSTVNELVAPLPFRGISLKRGPADHIARYVGFFELGARLIECIFSERSTAEHAVTQAIMDHFAVTAPPEQALRLRAFEIDVSLPEALRLVRATVRPADVTFEFEDSGTPRRFFGPRRRAWIRRRAMASTWQNGDLSLLLPKSAPSAHIREFGTVILGPHTATTALGVVRDPPLVRWWNGTRRHQALLWRCPDEDAVYEVHSISDAAAPLLASEFVLQCCRPPPPLSGGKE